jgi:predicted transcriptional regulator
MPKMTRDEIVQSPQFQNGDDTIRNSVQSHTFKSLKTLAYRSNEDTRALAVHLLLHANKPLSRSEICKGLKRSKSPMIVNLLEELVADGILKRYCEVRPNGVPMYFYSIGVRLDDYGQPIPEWLD